MNKYRLHGNGQVVTEAEYRALYPNISFPPVLRPTDADAILQSPPPAITEYQRAVQDGVKQDSLLNWVTDWDIRNFTAAEIVAHDAAKAARNATIIAEKISLLWQAADKYTSRYISGVAIGILTIGVITRRRKCLDVSTWSSQIWTEYYVRKAAITATSVVNTDFSMFGPIPYKVPELQVEIGL